MALIAESVDPIRGAATDEDRAGMSRLRHDAADHARSRPDAAGLDRLFAGPAPGRVLIERMADTVEVERARHYTEAELHGWLRVAVEDWRLPPDCADFTRWAYERFGLVQGQRVDRAALVRAAEDHVMLVSYLMSLYVNRGLLNRLSEANILRCDAFIAIFKSIQHAYYAVDAHLNVVEAREGDNDVGVSIDSMLFRFSAMSVAQDLKPQESLSIFVLRQLAARGYRRYKGHCYEQIYVRGPAPPAEAAEARAAGLPVPTESQFATHAWRQVSTIEKFIYHCTPKETQFEQWRNRQVRGVLKSVAEQLEHSPDIEFPDLKPDRHVFAFSTGIYDCLTLAYTPYVDPETGARSRIDHTLVASKFFDAPFPGLYAQAGDAWASIPTPNFQRILDYQELGAPAERERVCAWLYVMIGRLLYDVGEMDRWQVMAFIKGIAGSGKSTLVKVVQAFYNKADVAVLSANCQERFALESLLDCLVFVCSEVREDFRLSQGELQSMISGEDVAVNRKFKTVETRTWKAPGFFVGNQHGGWIDAQGSIARRFVMWEFQRKVKDAGRGKQSDPQLAEKIMAELPALLLKCNLAYRSAVHTYGDRDIWDVLPPYFLATQRRLKSQVNPLVGFIEDPDVFEHDKDRYVYLRDFKKHYKEWLQHNNFGRPPKFVPDHYESVFEEYNITIMSGTRMWNSTPINTLWVVGLGLKAGASGGPRPDGGIVGGGGGDDDDNDDGDDGRDRESDGDRSDPAAVDDATDAVPGAAAVAPSSFSSSSSSSSSASDDIEWMAMHELTQEIDSVGRELPMA